MDLTEKQLNLISAARRHVADAAALAGASTHISLDQAYHLAGYGPECARKALLSLRQFDKSIGHRFDTDDAISWAASLEVLALRYDLDSWGTRFPPLATWREDVRYERTGTRTKSAVLDLVKSSTELVDGVVLNLWLDGCLPDAVVP